jgi:hypothetical protein
MSEGGHDSGKALSGAASLLEKGAEFSFFCLIGNAFLLLDTCLVLFFNKNILTFSSEEISIANAVIFIFSLSFLNSMFFPMLRIFIAYNRLTRYLYNFMYIPIKEWWYGYYEQGYSLDFLEFSIARIIAIKHKDEFTLKRLESENRSRRSYGEQRDKTFAFGCLLAINIFLIDSGSVLSVTQSFKTFLWEKNIIVYCIYWLSIIAIFLLSIVTLSPKPDHIYYYPREIEKQSLKKVE